MPPTAEGFAARLVLGPALRAQPDRRLVMLVREGYEAAFEEIVRRYGKPLTRYATAIVGGHAEDVTQDAFSKALLALRRDGTEIELRPWLFRIVRNTALNDLRDRPPAAQELAESLIGGGGNPAEELERREELTDLIERLRTLPEPQRAAIVMRELEGLSHEEIATALGLSGGGARQAIYRARRALRDGLGMLLPLPLLKALLTGGGATQIEAAAAGAAGVGGGAAGAGMALKAATVTVLVAGAVGAGVAIDHGHPRADHAEARTPRVVAGESEGDSLEAPEAPTEPTRPPSDRAEDRSSPHEKPNEPRSSSTDDGSDGSSGGEGPGNVNSGTGSIGSSGKGPDGGESGSGSTSGSDGGPSSGSGGGDSEGSSGVSGDSGDAAGLSPQMEQPTEEAR